MQASRKKIFELTMAGLACTAFVLVAGPAFAGHDPQEDFIDDNFDIDDANEDEATGELDADHNNYRAEAEVQCAPFVPDSPAGTRIRISTYHPDEAKLRKEKAQVGQGQKDNQAEVEVRTGSDDAENTVHLTCEKASVDAAVKTKGDDQGKFKADAKNCDCEDGDVESSDGETNEGGDCATYEARLEQIGEDCDGFKALKGKIDGDTIAKLKIKGKGDASGD